MRGGCRSEEERGPERANYRRRSSGQCDVSNPSIDFSPSPAFAGNTGELLRLVLDHIVPANFDLENGDEQVLVTAAGTIRKLIWLDGRPHIDGVAIRPVQLEIEPHKAYILDSVLVPPSP